MDHIDLYEEINVSQYLKEVKREEKRYRGELISYW